MSADMAQVEDILFILNSSSTRLNLPLPNGNLKTSYFVNKVQIADWSFISLKLINKLAFDDQENELMILSLRGASNMNKCNNQELVDSRGFLINQLIDLGQEEISLISRQKIRSTISANGCLNELLRISLPEKYVFVWRDCIRGFLGNYIPFKIKIFIQIKFKCHQNKNK
ncbi:hypothetical protein BpHYR1_052813 [Brachionus plicatilis]|uniref:Uncharacterized protein n=1 Tax=Brachionus plicatilis TaxID=10195 RepID=A0A3M7P6P2_BRAPC|nr:hypothetical protein BpHYR1_052813 [Brachionus plicatilis]